MSAHFLFRLWLVASIGWVALIWWLTNGFGPSDPPAIWVAAVPVAVLGGIVWAAGGFGD